MTGYWQLFFILGICYGVGAAKQCSSPGKFPNDNVGSCDGYTICLMAGAGNFAQYNLTCPNGFIYNHNHNQCTNDTSYQCVPEFNCTEGGRFPNPFDTNCTSFIICVDGLNDIMTARHMNCL